MRIKNISKDVLGAVREYLGAKDGNDTSYDEEIIKMSPKEIMKKWSGWEIGDEHWADFIISKYKEMCLKEDL